jgi:hypothetical protein
MSDSNQISDDETNSEVKRNSVNLIMIYFYLFCFKGIGLYANKKWLFI